MNIYLATVNGQLHEVKASNQDKARKKLFHIYKKKFGKVNITDLKLKKHYEIKK